MNTYRVLIHKPSQNGNLKITIEARTQSEAKEMAELRTGGKAIGAGIIS